MIDVFAPLRLPLPSLSLPSTLPTLPIVTVT
jgi:hypothetical protein